VYLSVAVVLIVALTLLGKQIASQTADLAKAGAVIARDPHSIDRLEPHHGLAPFGRPLNELGQELRTAFSKNAMSALKRVGGQLPHVARKSGVRGSHSDTKLPSCQIRFSH
jgi:hypothetical protein